jgi:hypothetical protein
MLEEWKSLPHRVELPKKFHFSLETFLKWGKGIPLYQDEAPKFRQWTSKFKYSLIKSDACTLKTSFSGRLCRYLQVHIKLN